MRHETSMTSEPGHPTIDFRPVARADYPMLLRWRSQPHVRQFYQKTPPSLDGIAAKYGPLVRGELPTICHIALQGTTPFGCLQCYRNADYPEWVPDP
jgi:aminoglycoside 6'-N-acetyltransferase